MKRFILTLTLVLFAFSALAGETVLGTAGNEQLIFGGGSHRLLLDSGNWSPDIPSAGTSTYATATGCARLIADTNQYTAGSCNAAPHWNPMLSKATTLTRLSIIIGTAVSASSTFSCKARIFANGAAVTDSEVLIEPGAGEAIAANTAYSTAFSQRLPAGASYGIQFTNGSSCSNSGTCACGGGSQTLQLRVHGVQH